MSVAIFQQIREAIANLNPNEVREAAERRVRIGLYASSERAYERMERFFLAPGSSIQRTAELSEAVSRAGNGSYGQTLPVALKSAGPFDIEIFEETLPHHPQAFAFSESDPRAMVNRILERRQELGLPLARVLYPFRKPVIDKVIHNISRENALFSLATALPDIVPSLVELPWAIGEFASDTAFLTINQVRMSFLIAGASDRPIGYGEQKGEVASIIAGAFGWRALARELVGKIPFGGGLLPKAAIAYAGSFVVGLSLERYYSIGYRLSRGERRRAYDLALERGRSVVNHLLEAFRKT